MYTLGQATIVANNSTKVRPVAHATNARRPRWPDADRWARSRQIDEHGIACDVSDGKQNEFERSSDTPVQLSCPAKSALTIFAKYPHEMSMKAPTRDAGLRVRSREIIVLPHAVPTTTCAAPRSSRNDASCPWDDDAAARRDNAAKAAALDRHGAARRRLLPRTASGNARDPHEPIRCAAA